MTERLLIKLDEGALPPTRAHDTDAGLDLLAPTRLYIQPHGSIIVDTGVHTQLPHGYFGKLESKSGLNVKYDIVCLGGVIDEGYSGSIMVKLYNMGDRPHVFERGDKLVQLIVQPCSYAAVKLVQKLDMATERAENGFGSTGR